MNKLDEPICVFIIHIYIKIPNYQEISFIKTIN